MYEYRADMTKGGYRPLREEEWRALITEATVISDITSNRCARRVRVLYRDSQWYCWILEAGQVHTCFELTGEGRELSYGDWEKLRHIFQDIERFNNPDAC